MTRHKPLRFVLPLLLALGCGDEVWDPDQPVGPEREASGASCRVNSCTACVVGSLFTWKGACYKDSAGQQGFLWHNTALEGDSKIQLCTATPTSGTGVPTPTIPAGAQSIQSAIDRGDYAGAITAAISYYGLDCRTVSGGASGIYYDSSVSGDGYTAAEIRETAGGPTVALGFVAFKSPAFLATTIYHELIHTAQRADGRHYAVKWGPQGYDMNEAEAYKRSIDWGSDPALNPHLTPDEYNSLNKGFNLFYNSLDADN